MFFGYFFTENKIMEAQIRHAQIIVIIVIIIIIICVSIRCHSKAMNTLLRHAPRQGLHIHMVGQHLNTLEVSSLNLMVRRNR
jgi:uncharacterized protein YpmB